MNDMQQTFTYIIMLICWIAVGLLHKYVLFDLLGVRDGYRRLGRKIIKGMRGKSVT